MSCCYLLQVISLDAAGRIEELDRMRSEEDKLLTDHSVSIIQSSSLDLDSLCSQWSELCSSADEKAQLLSANLSHWNLYQSAVSRLMPCLGHAEQYVSDVTAKTEALTDAQKLLDDHQVDYHFSLLLIYR